MISGVYGFFDVKTLTCLYVGQSIDLDGRYKKHIKTLTNGTHLRKDWSLWYKDHNSTEDSMIFTLLDECAAEDLNSLEIFWFNELAPIFFGKQPSLKEEWRHSTETRNKISTSTIKRFCTNTSDHLCDFGCTINEKMCQSCGVKFQTPKRKNKQKFCSTKCGDKDRMAPYRNSLWLLPIEDLKKLYYEEKKSTTELGMMFNVSQQVAYRTLVRRGITLRSRGNVNTLKNQN